MGTILRPDTIHGRAACGAAHSPVTTMQRWHLAAHVRACRTDDRVVLLDLLRSRYVGIDGRYPLDHLVDGWPAADDRAVRPVAANDALIGELRAAGLVERGPQPERAPSDELEDPTTSLDLHHQASYGRIRARYVYQFAACATLSAARLRWLSLQSVAAHVAALRSRTPAAAAHQGDHLYEAVEAFDRLRPLAFTSRERCLYDSLALVTFLACERLHARWVIGVRTNPFRAHAWVQAGDTVLNDLHENVRAFRPILVV